MKLPQLSGIELIKRLRKHGFVVVRQRGSHFRLERNLPDKTIKITVPNHMIIKIGTLHRILKDAGINPDDI